jgi:DNA-binding NarL/FixJ family response regulator
MDIAMPGLGGLEAALQIQREDPRVKILVLTQFEEREYVARLLKAGASGYVLKKTAAADLVSAIRAVHRGGMVLDPAVAQGVVREGIRSVLEAAGSDPYESLTDREKQVLKLVAEGRSCPTASG